MLSAHKPQSYVRPSEVLHCRLEQLCCWSCEAGQLLLVVRQSARDTPLRVRTVLTGWAAVDYAGLDWFSPGFRRNHYRPGVPPWMSGVSRADTQQQHILLRPLGLLPLGPAERSPVGGA